MFPITKQGISALARDGLGKEMISYLKLQKSFDFQ